MRFLIRNSSSENRAGIVKDVIYSIRKSRCISVRLSKSRKFGGKDIHERYNLLRLHRSRCLPPWYGQLELVVHFPFWHQLFRVLGALV